MKKNDNVKKLQCVLVSYTVLLAKGLCTTRARRNHGLWCYLHVFRQKKKKNLIDSVFTKSTGNILANLFWPLWHEGDVLRKEQNECACNAGSTPLRDHTDCLYRHHSNKTNKKIIFRTNSFSTLTILSWKILHKAMKKSWIATVHKRWKAGKIRAEKCASLVK